MKRILLAAFFTTVLISTSSAEPTCVAIEDIGTLQANVDGSEINNFSLSSSQLRVISSIESVAFSYSVANRGSGRFFVSADVLLTDSDGDMVAALSATALPYVRPGVTDAISSETILSHGEFDRVSKICVRMAGFMIEDQ